MLVLARLLDLAFQCSALVLATRGDVEGLVNATTIAAVGADRQIVNIARGRVIDEAALIAALRAGTLGRATVDVSMDQRLPAERGRNMPNVIRSPHVAGISYGSLRRPRAAAVRNLETVFDGGPVVNELEGD